MKNLYLPGDYICESEGYIKGHGTEEIDDKIYSTYFGTVNQINKLIVVSPIFPIRYTAEIGDVVVGRVSQIYNRKWKLDTNCKNDTTLALSAINLPGVIQRRKSEEDEINMSKFFDINDIIVCEVQKVNKNGSAALHTRNDRYGRLNNGVLIIVSPDLLIPTKSRFLTKGPIEIISGCNGYIWIGIKEDNNHSIEIFKYVAKIRSKISELFDKNYMIDLENIIDEVVIN